ncbi:hypothetical protein LOAG_05149 [Loa loa]|uniref:Uncharacterized protein n=1 Tax=Loa loa TaxID=7209 RepID=A0A1S0U0N0_LOALO|nr:hypothetical protein LOAG_05149 [Loa loa]EFO23342.1 hypothetical protein LOAG_05149 [Loa loa]
MCCKFIPSFYMLLSIANAMHLGRNGQQQPYYFQNIKQQGMQPQSIRPQLSRPQPKQLQFLQHPEPQQLEQPEQPQNCIPTTPSYTRETTVWTIPPTQTPPTLAPTWTYATARPTPKSCMCACYMPPPCQICQPCQ